MEINLWKLLDLRAVEKEHAWRLFAALMQPVYDNNGETVRLFDTWHSLNEVVPPIGQPAIDFNPTNPSRHHSRLHFFDIPSQSAHLSPMMLAARTTKRGSLPFSEALVSDVKYNLPIAKWVKNQLMNTTTDASGTEVVASYNLMDKLVSGQAESLNFANIKGVMLKPAFTIVKHQGPTIIGRWEEKQGVVNPYSVNSKLSPLNADTRVSSERTWVKEAVVYPPNTVGQPNPTYYERDGTALDNPDVSGIPVFSVENDFHYVQLTQAMVDSLKNGILSELMGPNIDNIEVGDYAVLTSMHIATREVDDWTWQTFWWQPIGGETLAQNGVPADLRKLFKKRNMHHWRISEQVWVMTTQRHGRRRQLSAPIPIWKAVLV